MDHDLQKLISQLQNEKCPPRVLDRVAQRIAREKMPGRALRTSLAWIVSVACLFGVFAFWQGQARRKAHSLASELAAAQAQADRAQVVQQTQEAVGHIGQALIRAASHTENALLSEAVPPLWNGFEIVKNKVTRPK